MFFVRYFIIDTYDIYLFQNFDLFELITFLKSLFGPRTLSSDKRLGIQRRFSRQELDLLHDSFARDINPLATEIKRHAKKIASDMNRRFWIIFLFHISQKKFLLLLWFKY